MIHRQQEKAVEWEDYEQAVARLCSLSSALNQSNLLKLSLSHNLQSHLQVEVETLNRSNELDEMHEQLESLKLMLGKMSLHSKVVKENVKKQEEQLGAEVKSLLVAGTALSVASKHLREANASLAGERGCTRLKNLQKLLRLRQQYMVSQVSLMYPVKVVVGHTGDGSLTISGLHLSLLPFTEMNFFTNEKEVQRSATALGYVAHAVSLLASYLEVPLRYPLCMGGSKSYIRDYAPSVEPTVPGSASNVPVSSNTEPIDFPLFLEGQDTTRAAYAVFLLNKDLEQLLSFIGVESLGSRHVLANLRELLKTILSPESRIHRHP